ncbi:MAG: hypothetical protein G8237_07900 [Magnetococcales bacterium]|nr:hypothetical protein [Magnetococcales bacterium]NGZ06265.1 hypothetical protein [Magnetococcales bacterium]
MFESVDLMRIKMDLLREIPTAYSSLLRRLQKEGLAAMEGMDERGQSRFCTILDDYYDRFILGA